MKQPTLKPQIKDFIEHVFDELKAASPDGYTLNHEVEFEISVVTQATVDGKIQLSIASAGGSGSHEAAQKIKFVYSNAEKAAQNIDAEAHSVEKMMSAVFNPLVKMAKDFSQTKPVENPGEPPKLN